MHRNFLLPLLKNCKYFNICILNIGNNIMYNMRNNIGFGQMETDFFVIKILYIY